MFLPDPDQRHVFTPAEKYAWLCERYGEIEATILGYRLDWRTEYYDTLDGLVTAELHREREKKT